MISPEADESARRRIAERGETVKLKDAYTNMHTKGYRYIIAVEISKFGQQEQIDEEEWNEKRADWLNLSGATINLMKIRISEDGNKETPNERTLIIQEHQKPPKETIYGYGKSYPTYKENFYFVACLHIFPQPGSF